MQRRRILSIIGCGLIISQLCYAGDINQGAFNNLNQGAYQYTMQPAIFISAQSGAFMEGNDEYTDFTQDANCVGAWRFNADRPDQPKGVIDISGNDHHGTTVNTEVGDWTTGKEDVGLELDGTDEYLTVPTSTDFDFADDFTLMCWVEPDVVDADYLFIYRYDPATLDGIYLGQENAASGNFRFLVYVNGQATADILSDNLPTLNWQHVAGVRESDTAKLYIDGVLQSDTDAIAGAMAGTNPLYIGSDRTPGKYLNGKIDEIIIFDRALSQAEINKIIDRGMQ